MLKEFEALSQLQLPDDWQNEAIQGLNAGGNVIVQAPTGAGKTYIFEQFFIQKRLKGQAIYTVPTRALANDKYAEWHARGWPVGITTGDVSHQADAPLVIATLEAQQYPRNAAIYVIDEYQWLADPLRGNHYEGVIMSLPITTQLLLLSGSVANPDAVAAWLKGLGRQVRVITRHERPVPLDEVDVEGLARRLPDKLQGYWVRRVAGALREGLGPILVFAPHRNDAEKFARQIAGALPCEQPLRLSAEQERLAGKDLTKLLSQRVAYHHSGMPYEQRAGVVEPLAKSGQLRVVVATLGLSAGINFSLRSVLVTSSSYTRNGVPAEVTPAELLQMFGRAGRRGLDEQGFVLVAERSPRLSQARPQHLRRGTPLPWKPLLSALAQGEDKMRAARHFQRRLFSAELVPLGIEATSQIEEKLPCGLKTDPGRARLVRRENPPAPFCLDCRHRPDCLTLSPSPTLLWVWNRLGFVDRELELTPRGRIAAQFSGSEGLAVVAAIEDASYPLEEAIEDFANLAAGDRFCGMEARWGGRLTFACRKAYRRLTVEGFLQDGIPLGYGSGGAEMIRQLRQKSGEKAGAAHYSAEGGDVDRLWIEWRSLLRQIAGAETVETRRWRELQALARSALSQLPPRDFPVFPALTAEQQKPVNHRLYY